MDNLYSSVSRGGCYDTNHYGPRPLSLFKLNYLSEFATEAEKELVRLNLGIHNDSLVRKFIVEHELLKDQIPDHENIGTIYEAIRYLFEDGDAENARINSLEAFTSNLNELLTSAIEKLVGAVPFKYPLEYIGEGYNWPKLNEISGGYLKDLYDYTTLVEKYAKEVDSKIGTFGAESDGNPSSVRSYIDALDNAIKAIIGEYSTEKVNKDGDLIIYNKYGGNNDKGTVFTVKGAIDDLDKRLAETSDILTNADEVALKLEAYKQEIENSKKDVADLNLSIITTTDNLNNYITASEKNLENSINKIEKEVLDVIGSPANEENESAGLYKDVDDFKSSLNTDLNLVKASIAEVKTDVSDFVEELKGALETKEQELEETAKTAIDEHVATSSAGITKLVEDAKKATKDASKLVYGDPTSSDPEEQKSLQSKVDSAQKLVNSALDIIKEAEDSLDRTQLVNYYTKKDVNSIITNIAGEREQLNTGIKNLSGILKHGESLYITSTMSDSAIDGKISLYNKDWKEWEDINSNGNYNGITLDLNNNIYVGVIGTLLGNWESSNCISISRIDNNDIYCIVEEFENYPIDITKIGLTYYDSPNDSPRFLISYNNKINLCGRDEVSVLSEKPDFINEISDISWYNNYLYILDSIAETVYKCRIFVEESSLEIEYVLKYCDFEFSDLDIGPLDLLSVSEDGMYLGRSADGCIFGENRLLTGQIKELYLKTNNLDLRLETVETNILDIVTISNEITKEISHKLNIVIDNNIPTDPDANTFYFITE